MKTICKLSSASYIYLEDLKVLPLVEDESVTAFDLLGLDGMRVADLPELVDSYSTYPAFVSTIIEMFRWLRNVYVHSVIKNNLLIKLIDENGDELAEFDYAPDDTLSWVDRGGLLQVFNMNTERLITESIIQPSALKETLFDKATCDSELYAIAKDLLLHSMDGVSIRTEKLTEYWGKWGKDYTVATSQVYMHDDVSVYTNVTYPDGTLCHNTEAEDLVIDRIPSDDGTSVATTVYHKGVIVEQAKKTIDKDGGYVYVVDNDVAMECKVRGDTSVTTAYDVENEHPIKPLLYTVATTPSGKEVLHYTSENRVSAIDVFDANNYLIEHTERVKGLADKTVPCEWSLHKGHMHLRYGDNLIYDKRVVFLPNK